VIPDLLKRNNEVLAFDGMNPSSHNFELSLEYQARGACFNPYRALSSLQM
jgi:hypothetical protein